MRDFPLVLTAHTDRLAYGFPGGALYEMASPSLGGPALATDGTGASLAVWLVIPAPGGTDPLYRVMGLRFDPLGAPIDTAPFVIDGAVRENAAPIVTGLGGSSGDGGWAVVYTAAGVLLRIVSSGGVPSEAQVISSDGTAANPDIANLTAGFVIAWAETLGDTPAVDPYQGIRARVFDSVGTATGPVFMPATRRIGNQQRVTLASAGDVWIAAWSHAPAFGKPGPSTVRGRRYRGSVAIDAADLDITLPGSFAPMLATTANGEFVLAYEGVGGGGVDIGARRLPMGDSADISWLATSTAWSVAAGPRDEHIASVSAAGDADRIAVAYTPRIFDTPTIAFDGVVPGPEYAALVTAWGSDTVQNLTLARARRGIVCLWSSRSDALRGTATRGIGMSYLGVE